MAIMEFVERYQALQLQRDTSDELIKVGRETLNGDLLVTFLGSITVL